MPIAIELLTDTPCWVVAVSGDLEYDVCSEFRMAGDRVLRASPPGCVMDLSAVEFLDSSGLGLLLSFARDYGRAGGRLVLVTSDPADRVLELTRLQSVFDIAPTLDDAQERRSSLGCPGPA